MSTTDWRGERTFERQFVPADRFQRFLGDKRTDRLNGLGAYQLPLPLDWCVGRVENPNDCISDLRPDTISRNKCDAVCFHAGTFGVLPLPGARLKVSNVLDEWPYRFSGQEVARSNRSFARQPCLFSNTFPS